MSELQQIKNRIFAENRIEEVLELLGCWGIDTEQNGRLFVAGLPDGENKRSVQIKNNESLSSSIRSRGITGSIYDVISYIVYNADTEEKRYSNLSKSKYWLCTKLGYFEYIDEFYKVTSDKDNEVPKYNDWLKKIHTNNTLIYEQNEVKPKDIINWYGVVPYYNWLQEGLKISTQKHFQVGIDVQSERITFPIHNKNGDLIGIKGRYCGRNKEIEDKYKYLYLIPCNKSIEFFNLHRALPYIREKKEVIIVEGAKTTMFLTQWGYPNSISIEGDSLSNVQIQILKELGINIKYIFAFDKDKDVHFVKQEASKLNGRLKYGIMDTVNKLENKDSPTDKGKEVWDMLFSKCLYKI